jgi:twitching motility protein PilU
MNLRALLKFVVEKRGTDLFINVGAPPMLKIMGSMKPIGQTALTAENVREIVESILEPDQLKEFEEKRQIDLGHNIENAGRFRLNIYYQKGEPAIVARYIVSNIPSLSALNLPSQLEK